MQKLHQLNIRTLIEEITSQEAADVLSIISSILTEREMADINNHHL